MDLLLPLVLVVGVMWLMTNRNRKQQREAADFRANLTVGQEVMTGSGLFGTIVAVDGDTITLESTPGNHTRWIRAAIAKLVPPAEDGVADEEELDDESLLDEDDTLPDDEALLDRTPDDTRGSGAHAVTGDRTGSGAADPAHGLASADHRIDVPDDLSTLDERRRGDGPDAR